MGDPIHRLQVVSLFWVVVVSDSEEEILPFAAYSQFVYASVKYFEVLVQVPLETEGS